MALVTSYTRKTLIAYIGRAVQLVSTDLGLDDALPTAADATTRLLGLTDIAAATDMLKVETIATWQGWLAAYEAATIAYDLKAGSGSLSQSQQFGQIERRLAMAEAAALRYPEAAAAISGGATATVTTIGAAGSPYAPVCSW